MKLIRLFKNIKKNSQVTENSQSDSKQATNVEEENIGYGDYNIVIAKKINVLLIGRSQVGKTTIATNLLYPYFGSQKLGVSDTKIPFCYSLVIVHNGIQNIENDNVPDNEFEFNESKFETLENLKFPIQLYQLNIVDTPGLTEISKDGKETVRSDEQIMKIIDTCLKIEVTGFNLICYVTEYDKIQQFDISIFKKFISVFDKNFSAISLLLITHGDKCSIQYQDEIRQNIKEHENSKDIANYCQLGIEFCGALCANEVLSVDDSTVREGVVKDRLRAISKMRNNLLKIIVQQAGNTNMLTHKYFTGYVENAQSAKRKMCEAAVKEKEKSCLIKNKIYILMSIISIFILFISIFIYNK
jgi:GTPase SAR1 family protein